jgi:hypothetical protein
MEKNKTTNSSGGSSSSSSNSSNSRSRNIKDYQSLVGMTLEEGKQIYRKMRVIKKDGEILPGTEEIRSDRLNVGIVNDVITEVIAFM